MKFNHENRFLVLNTLCAMSSLNIMPIIVFHRKSNTATSGHYGTIFHLGTSTFIS